MELCYNTNLLVLPFSNKSQIIIERVNKTKIFCIKFYLIVMFFVTCFFTRENSVNKLLVFLSMNGSYFDMSDVHSNIFNETM